MRRPFLSRNIEHTTVPGRELHYKVRGHSEVVTAMSFSATGGELITVSVDSCIFVWRIGSELRRAIRQRLAQRGRPHAPPATLGPDTPAAPSTAAQTDSGSSLPQQEQQQQQPEEEEIEGAPPAVPALQLSQLPSAAAAAGEPLPTSTSAEAAAVINLSETLLPKWAKNASIEVAHRKVKSDAVPTSARAGKVNLAAEQPSDETEAAASDAGSQPRWASDVHKDILFVDPAGSPTADSPRPPPSAADTAKAAATGGGGWDAVRRSNVAPNAKQQTPGDYSDDGEELEQDDMVVCDVSDDDDGEDMVVFFGRQDHSDGAAFEVTQSMMKVAPASSAQVSRVFPSWNRSILTEIYLCHACSDHEIDCW
jgi:hypothetical protein